MKRRRWVRWALAPVRVGGRGGRAFGAWAKRPAGRLILPGVVVLILLGAAGTAGAYLVPQALDSTATATPGTSAGLTDDPAAGALPSASAPVTQTGGVPVPETSTGVGATAGAPVTTTAPTTTTQTGTGTVTGTGTGQRPSEALAGWAQQVGTKVGIPVVAVQAYGYAELVTAQTTPGCHLSWTTLAAIGKVESNHGSYNGSVLGADGVVRPPIYGLPLDGKGGRQLILDTDHGTIDGDTTYDRAVGPLQFVPQTWLAYKVDADDNGVADPNDIDDAAMTAAKYLCSGGRDLSKPDSWWDAILSYNAVQPYAQNVFNAANDYGQRSR